MLDTGRLSVQMRASSAGRLAGTAGPWAFTRTAMITAEGDYCTSLGTHEERGHTQKDHGEEHQAACVLSARSCRAVYLQVRIVIGDGVTVSVYSLCRPGIANEIKYIL